MFYAPLSHAAGESPTTQQIKELQHQINELKNELKKEKEKSSQHIDVKKVVPQSYEDVAKALFQDKPAYYTNRAGEILKAEKLCSCFENSNNAISRKQLEKLLAINMLMNVSRFLNGPDWEPDWDDELRKKWIVQIKEGRVGIAFCQTMNFAPAFFKTEEFTQQAIDILGEDTIRLALSTDW